MLWTISKVFKPIKSLKTAYYLKYVKLYQNINIIKISVDEYIYLKTNLH